MLAVAGVAAVFGAWLGSSPRRNELEEAELLLAAAEGNCFRLEELAEAGEKHDAQLASFVAALRRGHKQHAAAMFNVRRAHYLRLSLHALASHARERSAWRGAQSNVLLTDRLCTRRVARAVLVAWQVAARASAAARQQTSAVASVVSER